MTDTPARPSVWTFQYRVIKALVLREMMSRYGQSRLGYAWALIQPALVIVGLLLVFSVKSRLAPPNLPLYVFLLTGYPFWFVFQDMWQSLASAETSGQNLLMFPQITIFDLMAAKLVLEFATQTVVWILLCALFIMIGGIELPTDPGGALMAYWSCIWIGACVGIIAASVRRFFPMFEDWLRPIRRLGIFVSGVIFTAASLPSSVLPYFSWNPVFRAIEIARQSWHPTYQSPIYDPMYVGLVCLCMGAVALILERLTRRAAGQ